MHLIPFVLHALISFALEKPIKLANKYLRRWAYTGQRVGKNWTGYFNFEGLSGQEKITIKQFGTLIEGSISTDINDGEYQLESNLTGELFNEEYLMAIYRPNAKDAFGSGAIVLKLIDGGKRLKGCSAYQYSRDRDLKILPDYEWIRAR